VAGRVAAGCGAYALEHPGTTSHRFTLEEFSTRYAENFGAEPRLARLTG
jgi:adenosine kinase